MMNNSVYHYDISYGKVSVPVYRVYARPLAGAPVIPESPFTGRSNELMALEVDVEVFGDNFLPSYTRGDNSGVVATDSMKNFILSQALAYDGATLEEFLDMLGHGFLSAYPRMHALRLTGREQPFTAVTVAMPADTDTDRGNGATFEASRVLFGHARGDHAFGELDYRRGGADGLAPTLAGHRCGLAGLRLVKITGSSFTRFVRDEHTTLPERTDRPLYIYLDLSWTYNDPTVMLDGSHAAYIPAEQVRDLVCTVFHSFVSESIQHLVHEMGTRLLQRFPQMATVGFAAQNHTWDPVARSSDDPKIRVYTDAFVAYGLITLTISRDTDGEATLIGRDTGVGDGGA